MSSDKAQYQALSLHTAQQQPLNALYRANGRLLAACEVEHVTIGQKVYSTAQLAEMAALWEEVNGTQGGVLARLLVRLLKRRRAFLAASGSEVTG